ncbi:aspartate kinase [Fulvivirgaceae bacterium BMA10]|uniref:Aspartokinase n=1 Tax=Splendidivirga corallicola TaxID=3051826 RepID=A0ABT8KUL2_9BACT|nr:aspartate kinase [Fulvivirgaceae bacterium BMA10]
MKVLKFGGTSVGKPERMHQVADIITSGEDRQIVVLSAVSGTTNALVEIGEMLASGNKSGAKELSATLKLHYQDFVQQLYHQEDSQSKGNEIVNEHFNFVQALIEGVYSEHAEKVLLAQGELLSTKLFYEYLREIKVRAAFLEALDFMSIDENQEPEIEKISKKLSDKISEYADCELFITQGFICKNHRQEVDNLKRGGSDYTASLIGAAIKAEEVQIWTDIDGMHNNDPRIVEKTFPIALLSFDEAAELSYFGAKILHPASIWPAQKFNVPVRLKNTMQPEAKGTYINKEHTDSDIKAIAAKDGITAIKIKSSRMLLAYGFLRKVFEIFEKYRTPIDLITTSEVAISLTIDEDTHLDQITSELKSFGTVEIDREQTIVCIVGSRVVEQRGIVRKIFDSLEDIPVRMISYGGSKNNISILIDTDYKKQTLDKLNTGLFSLNLC